MYPCLHPFRPQCWYLVQLQVSEYRKLVFENQKSVFRTPKIRFRPLEIVLVCDFYFTLTRQDTGARDVFLFFSLAVTRPQYLNPLPRLCIHLYRWNSSGNSSVTSAKMTAQFVTPSPSGAARSAASAKATTPPARSTRITAAWEVSSTSSRTQLGET